MAEKGAKHKGSGQRAIGTAKEEGAMENKKYFSEQERDKASSHKIGARASLAEKPLWTKAGSNLQSSG